MLNAIYMIVGIGLLTAGGEALIRGALGAANRFGVSPLFSGVVIVGFGTSMPEMVVSVEAALGGQPDIAIGNVVGSNIANILLILGCCAVLAPVAVSVLALKRDALVMLAASVLFIALAQSNNLSSQGALVLLISLFAYLAVVYRSEKRKAEPAMMTPLAEAGGLLAAPTSAAWSALAIVVGLALLIAGSKILLVAAVGLAQGLGVSEAVIGLTLVAVGTSLPELAISVIAALKRQTELVVGNVLGSNIFNLLGILGVSALLQPLEVQGRILAFDQWLMLGSTLLLIAFLYTGRRLSRIEGVLLLTGYAAYVGASYMAMGG